MLLFSLRTVGEGMQQDQNCRNRQTVKKSLCLPWTFCGVLDDICTSGHSRAVDKSPLFCKGSQHYPHMRPKSKCPGGYPRHFTLRLRLKAAADRRQWSSDASNPRRNRCLKLCRAFSAAKVPSHQICRRSRMALCSGVPSPSWFFFTAFSKIFT